MQESRPPEHPLVLVSVSTRVVRAESVLAAVLLHGVFNGFIGLIITYATADNAVLAELVNGSVSVADIVAFILATVVIALTKASSVIQEMLSNEPSISASKQSTVGTTDASFPSLSCRAI